MTKEERAIAIFETEEEFYKEIAWHCYVTKMRVGEAFEGMRHDFDKLWNGRKEYLVNKIIEQLPVETPDGVPTPPSAPNK